MRRELFTACVVMLILVVFPGALFGYQAWRVAAAGARVVEIAAYAPAQGGWQPENVRVSLGERVRLRVSSADVVHGFVAPDLGLEVEEIQPGHVAEVEFTADKVGRFAFACNRWCSADHWRMRGTIEVVDPANPNQLAIAPAAPPLYSQLQLDLDAPRPPATAPAVRPSAARGAALASALPPELRDRAWLLAHSPQEAFHLLRAADSRGLGDDDLWDIIAATWLEASGPGALARGAQLYARDCAACHGEAGKGDGPAGRNLAGRAAMHLDEKRGPVDFTDAARQLSASDALLQGKALRGGMGTGMPEWGSLYSQQDLAAVVSYLRAFVFDYGRE